MKVKITRVIFLAFVIWSLWCPLMDGNLIKVWACLDYDLKAKPTKRNSLISQMKNSDLIGH